MHAHEVRAFVVFTVVVHIRHQEPDNLCVREKTWSMKMKAVVVAVALTTLLYAQCRGHIDDKLYLLEIKVHLLTGKEENLLVHHIKEIIDDYEIDVLFQFKELGNPVIVIVMKMENDCTWSYLSTQLFEANLIYTSTPLFSCEDFAHQLGMDLPGLTTNFGDGNVEIARLKFTAWDFTFEEYNEIMRDHMRITREMITERNMKVACFKHLSSIPEQMIYFNLVLPSQSIDWMMMFHAVDRFLMKVITAYDLREYKDTC